MGRGRNGVVGALACLAALGALGPMAWGAQAAEAPAIPAPSPSPSATWLPTHLQPLPGGLDRVPMLVSNSPEVLTEAGITVSTMAAPSGARGLPFLGAAPVEGPLTVFMHHIAKGAEGPDRLLHVALLAHNPGDEAVRLQLKGGASFVSQPDAPFVPLPSLLPDPLGTVYAGPGDRVAVNALLGRSGMGQRVWSIPPGGSVLVWQAPIPIAVPIPPRINGRSALLALLAEGPLHFSASAAYAPRLPDGEQVAPALRDHLALLAKGQAAGPRELAPPSYEPTGPLPKPFRYGRVAGLAEGAHWRGDLALAAPARGQRIAWPVATARANSWGTGQVQSGAMLARVADTAWGNHGNYGVAYRLRLRLRGGETAREVALALGHPKEVQGQGAEAKAMYLDPPGPGVTWRGPILVREGEGDRLGAPTLQHLVLKAGQAPVPFHTLRVPAHGEMGVELRWIYPPDATPPQLLQLEGL